jgi:two-component system, NtrC family, response regulator AtoC
MTRATRLAAATISNRRPTAARPKDIRELTRAAESARERYPFPGNVRELRNVIERAVILCPPGRMIDLPEPPGEIAKETGETDARNASELGAKPDCLRETMRHHEATAIMEALKANNGNRTRAAVALGVSRRALQETITRCGLGPTEKAEGGALCVAS